MKFALLPLLLPLSASALPDGKLLFTHQDSAREFDRIASSFASSSSSSSSSSSKSLKIDDEMDVNDLINCTEGQTACAAGYSAIGVGCCPFESAVCCPNKQTCCPSGTSCVETGPYTTTCVPASGGGDNVTGLSVCKSGPDVPLSTTLKNVLVIGDSVSIGYTPYVAKRMADKALVLHSPLDVRDGGAEETAYGEQCLENFLHAPSGEFLKPDVIMFNWGLHDGPLGNSTVPGQAGLPDVYAAQLTNITKMLKALQPQAKLLFALSSAQLCDPVGDGCVVNLNNQAKAIMDEMEIPTINLHDAIVGQCGEPPQTDCWGVQKCFCPHCSAGGPNQGYDWLAETTIVPALEKLI